MNLWNATFSAAVLVLLLGGALPAESAPAPGATLQRVRTQARVRRGVGEDIVVSNRHADIAKDVLIGSSSHVGTDHLGSDTSDNLFASLTSDSPILELSEEPYPGQKLREVRSFSRVRRGVGEDIWHRLMVE